MDKMKLGEFARRVGLHPSTIRRLEREGVIEADRSLAGYRLFDKSAIEKVRKLYRERRATNG